MSISPFLIKTLISASTLVLLNSTVFGQEEQHTKAVNSIDLVTTIPDTSPIEKIHQHFLYSLADAAMRDDPILELDNPKSFKYFLKLFKYKTRNYSELSGLSEIEFNKKIVNLTINNLSPYFDESIITQDGSFYLASNTIRGLLIYVITKQHFVEYYHKETYKDWNLYIFSSQSFSKEIILNDFLIEFILNNHIFKEILLHDLSLQNKDSHFWNKDSDNLFYIVPAKKGYDVASITHEDRYYRTAMEKQNEIYFLSLPIVQYTEEGGKFFDFFFWLQDIKLLKRLTHILESKYSNLSSKSITNNFMTYINGLENNNFDPHEFSHKLKENITSAGYKINYDAIAQQYCDEVFDSARIFLLGQGITEFPQLANNRLILNKVIEKFFVLGTTYFYRNWPLNSNFINHVDDSIEIAKKEKRPLKLKIFACSSGEEALTFAFELIDNGITDFRILGTDINAEYIRQASSMTYNSESFERLPGNIRNNILNKYFVKSKEQYVIKDKGFFKDRIQYLTHDILTPLPDDLSKDFAPPYDFVTCQNIFLYLNPKIVPQIYERISKLINPYGQIIVQDKFYQHRSFNLDLLNARPLHINKSILKLYPSDYPSHRFIETVKNCIKEHPSNTLYQHYFNPEINKDPTLISQMNHLIQEPGNHLFLHNIKVKHLIKRHEYEEAKILLMKLMHDFPLQSEFLIQMKDILVKLGDQENANYYALLLHANSTLFRDYKAQSISQALQTYRTAFELFPNNNIGYLCLGYQFLRIGKISKNKGMPLIDVEQIFNQALKNFNLVLDKNPDSLSAKKGIAEIANYLSPIYEKTGKKEIEERLIYNALRIYEKDASSSEELRFLLPLGELLSKMGIIYHRRELKSESLHSFNKAIQIFKQSEKSIVNHSSTYAYHFYLQFAQTEFDLYMANKTFNPFQESSDQLLLQSLAHIDDALWYNTVYGIEAVELQKTILRLNPKLRAAYRDALDNLAA